MRHWSSFGGVSDKLVHEDYQDMDKVAFAKALTPNLRLYSDIMKGRNLQTWSHTTLAYNSNYGFAKMGFNVAPNMSPSGFLLAKMPFTKGPTAPGCISFNVNKAWWRTDPYFGVKLQHRWQNVAVSTSLGSNPGQRMTQTADEAKGVRDFEISNSITVGSGPIAFGAHLKVDPNINGNGFREAQAVDYNVGADYKEDSYGFGVRTVNKMSQVKADAWANIRQWATRRSAVGFLRAGSVMTYDRATGNACTGIGLHLHNSDAQGNEVGLKAKADTDKNVGAAMYSSAKGWFKGHVSVQHNVPSSSTRCGVGFTFGDY